MCVLLTEARGQIQDFENIPPPRRNPPKPPPPLVSRQILLRTQCICLSFCWFLFAGKEHTLATQYNTGHYIYNGWPYSSDTTRNTWLRSSPGHSGRPWHVSTGWQTSTVKRGCHINLSQVTGILTPDQANMGLPNITQHLSASRHTINALIVLRDFIHCLTR